VVNDGHGPELDLYDGLPDRSLICGIDGLTDLQSPNRMGDLLAEWQIGFSHFIAIIGM